MNQGTPGRSTVTAPAPPAATRPTPVEWARANLFDTWYNALLTLVFAPLAAWALYGALRFAFVTGRWEIVEVNLTNLMVGRFPRGELWRVWTGIGILAAVLGVGLGIMARITRETAAVRGVTFEGSWQSALRRATPPLLLILVVASFVRTTTPLVALAGVAAVGAGTYVVGLRLPSSWHRLVTLGIVTGLVAAYGAVVWFGGVSLVAWGGLLLTMFFAVAGIALSYPLGVLLALGRRSSLPAVRVVCGTYIELIRGSPLIALIFIGWLVLPFFLPPGFPIPDRPWRVLIIFVLFTAAYVAEIVRGGLQGLPRGQVEAGQALGLSPWKVTRLIVLPQALRSVIPATVGQFISLFKDTSLVLAIGLLDLLRVATSITQQPQFLGRGLHAETLAFAAFIYWVGSYWMSRESQRLERRLGVGER
jgi:general L-amino acid transport system permease protein